MRPYVVRQGDYLAKIAAALGCAEGELWEHPQNQPLRDAGRTPELLAPGDVLYVPDGPSRTVDARLQSDNAFTAWVPEVSVRVTFQINGVPRASQRYKVLDTGRAQEGLTDAAGLAAFDVAMTARTVRVVFDDPPAVYHVNIGFTDPSTERAGVFDRLRQLGYLPMEATAAEVTDGRVRGALAAFQQDHGLTPSGETDDATRERLVAAFGS